MLEAHTVGVINVCLEVNIPTVFGFHDETSHVGDAVQGRELATIADMNELLLSRRGRAVAQIETLVHTRCDIIECRGACEHTMSLRKLRSLQTPQRRTFLLRGRF